MPSTASEPGWLRLVFLRAVARPLALLMTGADVMHRGRLPKSGPAILAANHNSHVDTLLLLSVFDARTVGKVRPVAAADYFLSNPVLSWFSRRLVGITPIARKVQRGEDVLAPAKAALDAGEIVLVFPEGSRGQAEALGPLKGGVARLAEAYPDAPLIPVWIQGAGRVLPKGAHLPVPLTCCVVVGEPVSREGGRPEVMARLKAALEALRDEAPPLRWREEETALEDGA
ncbi:lysophospholipid acyltransferase family protein [Brevundimonas sp. 2R-24]|uniref:Lysophospholipid acyltransferase family protein n=1 Tax=Peiella sedimenti TaxID=3061083 RepID=A0ABT8SHH9_9CAUL|nr:lysophospholipid acyltransferase family protein [Caulobacteraceae bacterium XZ-24]